MQVTKIVLYLSPKHTINKELLSNFNFITKIINNMTKNDLISAIAKDAGITKAEAQNALDSFTKNVTDALKKDDKVTLIGFGTFQVNKRNARDGRNPQTGKTIKIAAKNVAKFKAGKALDEKLN